MFTLGTKKKPSKIHYHSLTSISGVLNRVEYGAEQKHSFEQWASTSSIHLLRSTLDGCIPEFSVSGRLDKFKDGRHD